MSRRSRLLALVFAVAAAPLYAADTYTVDKNHSDASFRVRHFASKVRGSFGDFEGTIQADAAKPELSSVVFMIKTASINTNNPDRDKHLQSPDFFDAAKCPEISFKSSKIVPAGKDRYTVTGMLTMHCVSKEVTVPVEFLGIAKDPWGNERASFDVTTKLNRKDWGLNWNAALETGGFLVSDKIKLVLEIEANKVS